MTTIDNWPFEPRDSQDFELDKIKGWWTMTYWPRDQEGLVLRLKLQHTCSEDPNNFVCEIRFKPCEEFQQLAKGDLASYSVDYPERDKQAAKEIYFSFPAGWRIQFWAMARRFSRILRFIELGATANERYAGEPATSRDFFERDDPPNQVS